MKRALVLMLGLTLTACGGGDNKPNGSSQAIGGNALATHAGPCPVIDGKFAQPMEDGENKVIFLNTVASGGNYSYSFVNPAFSRPQFDLADGAFHQIVGEPVSGNLYRVSCDANSITYVTQEPGAATISIRYIVLDQDHLRVEPTGGGHFLAGDYTRVPGGRRH